MVSRLDGDEEADVITMIDNAYTSDLTGEKTWVLDHDPTNLGHVYHAWSQMDQLGGFNINTDATDPNAKDIWITTNGGEVIGYVSHGMHACKSSGQCMPETYIIDGTLKFDYAHGAIFNSVESYNGNSFFQQYRASQGLVTDFIQMGGTVGVGNVWEPTQPNICVSGIAFPQYGVGYSLIDAIYQGIPHIAFRQTVAGDPLTIIWDATPIVLPNGYIFTSGDYYEHYYVQEGNTVYVAADAILNFLSNASMNVDGNIVFGENSIINFKKFSSIKVKNVTLQSDFGLNFSDNSSLYVEEGLEVSANLNFEFKNNSRLVVLKDGTLTFNAGAKLEFKNYSQLLGDKITLGNNSKIIFYDNSDLIANDLEMLEGAYLSFSNINDCFISNNIIIERPEYLLISNLSTKRLLIEEGSELTLSNTVNNIFSIENTIMALGTVNNLITINNAGQRLLNFSNPDTVLFSYTTIDGGAISVGINSGSLVTPLISINNCTINNSLKNSFIVSVTDDISINFNHNVVNSNNNDVLLVSGFENVQLKGNIIQNDYILGLGYSKGMVIYDNTTVNIENCQILGFTDGIVQERTGEDETSPTNNEDIRIYNCTIDGRGYSLGVGISLGYDLNNTPTAAKIDINNISDFSACIAINNPNKFPIGITNNVLSNFGLFGVSLNGGNEAIIRDNIITVAEPSAENAVGISVIQVKNPSILSNTISAENVTNPGVGLFSVSSNGEIRNNLIQYYSSGVEIGSSSPNIGANTLIHNRFYGIYMSDNSHPNFGETLIGENERYPVTGYNTIMENGPCEVFPNYSELYLRGSTANLKSGCNTIADDRSEVCDYLYLIDGDHVEETIYAQKNYWGELNDHNPEGRFGENITVDYEGYLDQPCTYSSGGNALLLANSQGEVYDTIYSSGETPSSLTDIETRYAAANEYYYNNHFTQAKQEYESIIQDYGDSTESLQAYNRLYSLANLMNSLPETFNQLKDFYVQEAGNQTDSIMIRTLTHLSDLCLVSATEYVTAINNFDEEAQQNPNTDIALYRQIDALTTSLLMPQDSTMNKGILGKYSVNGLSDYANKLSELIKTRGKSGLESEKELLPTEYTLYQNYPNPFNPVTTIKYDLPTASDISLIIYDILGRKVKELVNTKQQAGRNEVQFDASNFASGVYIYQIIANQFIGSKKMILLK